jgi:glyoxylase-like metal-dependent hydrolase (beta-lactamase superfamily II)
MKRIVILIASLWLAISANASDLHMQVFSAKTANVNSFIFFDSLGSLIVDTTRNSKDALEVAKRATKGTGPVVIFITHGHPDHYLGMGELKRKFPSAKIFVASQEIKDDIIASAQLMEQLHVLDSEPLMKAKSEINPNGFDYQGEIQVLTENTLRMPSGKKIEVIANFPATEAAHETMLFSKDLNSLFASDLAYNGVHLWMGRGVDSKAIGNWQRELMTLKSQFGQLNVKVYPGHGPQTDSRVFDADFKYINEFLSVVKNSKTQDEAKNEMIKRYPTWENADFILVQSIKNQFELLQR